LSTSGSFSFCQTVSRGAGSSYSPLIVIAIDTLLQPHYRRRGARITAL
jgi:hypothetical protein